MCRTHFDIGQRLRDLQRSRLELSAGRTPSFIADCCSVCQALETLLVLMPERAPLMIFLRYTNVLFIIIIIVVIILPSVNIIPRDDKN